MPFSREQLAYDLALIHARTKFEQVFLEGRNWVFSDLDPSTPEPDSEYNFISTDFIWAFQYFMEDDRRLDSLFPSSYHD